MSYEIERALLALTPYEPVEGEYEIRLDANESFLRFPKEITAQFAEAASSLDYRRYPDPTAKKLNEAYAAYLGIDPKLLVAGNGSDELIGLIENIFLHDGDRVVTALPDFSMYAFYASVRRCKVMPFQKAEDYTFSVEKLADFVNRNQAKLLVFSNPCNPTGGVILAEEVLKLAQSCNALVVADEAYMDFSDQSVVKSVLECDNLIVLRTMSKAFASAALRIGFAISNPAIIRVLSAAKSPYNVNALSQKLGELILSQGDFSTVVRALIDSKNQLFARLSQCKTVANTPFTPLPSHTNFICVKTTAAKEIFQSLLKEGIAVRAFPDFLRISAGSEWENDRLIDALKKL